MAGIVFDKSVALRYRKDLPAPFLVAKGRARLAARLVEIAKKHHIPVLQQGELTDVLFDLEIGDFIPEELYSILAEIFIFVYRLQEDS